MSPSAEPQPPGREPAGRPPYDACRRPLRRLRLSVTDRCNLRCRYCMPEESYTWLPRGEILRFDEIDRLVQVLCGLGVRRVRLTGGEPLLRRGLPTLIALLWRSLQQAAAADPAGEAPDLALTTNGVLLAGRAAELRAAGLQRLTISLDTLRPERFAQLTRVDAHERVLAAIVEARRAGFDPLKIDAVVMRGFNDDELGELLRYGCSVNAEVRFIEYMDVGGATRWSPRQVMSRAAMLEQIEAELGPVSPLGDRGSSPAERFALPDGATFGIIASTTTPFCRDCDRGRITADGMWLQCLYAETGTDLKTPLRQGATAAELAALIARTWQRRDHRGAERQAEAGRQRAAASAAELRRDPHLEMHKRGG